MNTDDRKRLFVYENTLVNGLIFREIGDHLYQNRVISSEELKLISQEKTYEAQIRKLLSLIVKKPQPDLLKRFCLALQETGDSWYESLGEVLLDADISFVNADKDELEFFCQDNFNVLGQQIRLQSKYLNKEFFMLDLAFAEQMSAVRQNLLDPLKSSNLVTKHMSEFITKPRKAFTDFERKACQMGLASSLCHVDSPAIRSKLEEDLYGTGKAVDESVLTMSRLVRSEEQMSENSIVNMIKEMNGFELNGFHTMNSIADKLFCFGQMVDRDRIVTWFSFWGRFVNNLRPLEVDDPVKFVRFYSEFAGFYLAKRLQSSIAKAGGWMPLIGPS